MHGSLGFRIIKSKGKPKNRFVGYMAITQRKGPCSKIVYTVNKVVCNINPILYSGCYYGNMNT